MRSDGQMEGLALCRNTGSSGKRDFIGTGASRTVDMIAIENGRFFTVKQKTKSSVGSEDSEKVFETAGGRRRHEEMVFSLKMKDMKDTI